MRKRHTAKIPLALPALSVLLATLLASTPVWSGEGQGLKSTRLPTESRTHWRLGLGTSPHVLGRFDDRLGALAASLPPPRSAMLLGDYFLGETGGLRATGGLLLGRRTQPWNAAPRLGEAVNVSWHTPLVGSAESQSGQGGAVGPRRVPYIGMGYSSVSFEAGWGFSADLGLMALQPGAVSQALNSPRNADDVLRDLRLRPSLQLGVSYAF